MTLALDENISVCGFLTVSIARVCVCVGPAQLPAEEAIVVVIVVVIVAVFMRLLFCAASL